MKVGAYLLAALLALVLVLRRRRLEPTLLVGGALVVLALCIYGTGLVHVPNLERLLLDVGGRLGAWTYLLVAGFAFLETGAFIGLLAPGETAMILGGVVAGQGQISIVTLIAVTWAAAVAGDCLSFELGRRLGRGFIVRHGSRFQMTEERLATVEAFFERHGGKAILLGRFVGLVRAIAPFLAGSGRMSFRRFIPYDVLGAGLWATTFLMLGFVFGRSLDTLLKVAKQGALGLGIAISVVVGVVWLVRYLRVPENRAALAARFDAALERPLLRPLRPAVRWLRGPARFLVARLTPGRLGLELTTLLAIGAVGSFAFFGTWINVAEHGAVSADHLVHRWAVDLWSPAVASVAKVLTWLGAPIVIELVAAAATLALVLRRRWPEAIVLAAGLLLTLLLVQIAKHAVGRARPPDELVSAYGPSFPSGHSAYAMTWIVLAVIGVRVVPALRGRWWLVGAACVLAALVGATRLYLRVHWLADVLGGQGAAALAFSIVAIVVLVVTQLRHNEATT
ncbi:MAG TPA: bifunctional DedA family/phosphatase PAP2 family protein [Solirubrobacteraceae bacterium]|nr:bifunctional DedA family/phosphatase PAP2 family protein [Solirubrobacteraceae bacterium]